VVELGLEAAVGAQEIAVDPGSEGDFLDRERWMDVGIQHVGVRRTP
jgi:hypothetical protein